MYQKLKNNNFIIVGPQASGKGTQTELLAKKYHLQIFSTGDIIRDYIKQSKDKNVVKVKKIVEQGKLVPEKNLSQILKNYFDKIDLNKGVVFDGYPRNRVQLSELVKIFKKKKADLPVCLLLTLPTKTVIKRIQGRKICSECKRIYRPPQSLKLKKCSNCGGELQTRADDKSEAIRQRLKIYHIETKPIIQYFKDKNKLITINGEPDINIVFKDAMNQIQQYWRDHDNN